MPKTRKPVADYITYDQFKQMVKEEPDPMWKLLYRYMWAFMLRVSEIVGQNKHDVKAIKTYREYSIARFARLRKAPEHIKRNHKGKFKFTPRWTGALPGIRAVDIDHKAKTLRVYRKHGKFDVLPYPASDPDLLKDTSKYMKEHDLDLHPTRRLFPRSRRSVLTKMQSYGSTVGGQTLIHPHALRRGGGVHFRDKGGKIEVLQVVYNHEKMSQTLDYIGRDKKAALEEFAKA